MEQLRAFSVAAGGIGRAWVAQRMAYEAVTLRV
jgi:hypothetical protein